MDDKHFFWDDFCDKNEILGEGVPLFECDGMHTEVFSYGKDNRLILKRSQEMEALVDRSTLQGKRDYSLLNLLVRTALRTVEVIRAEVWDIRQETGEAVLWIQGKGRDVKDEFVLLTQDTLKLLNEYLQTRGRVEDKAPLFASLSDRNRDERLTTRTIR